MDIQFQNLENSPSLYEDIFYHAQMIIASLFIVLALACLLKNNRPKNKKMSQPLPLRKSFIAPVKQFHFDMNSQQQSDQEFQAQEIQNILRVQDQQNYTHTYSLKQAKNNFLKNLKASESQDWIYLDQQDRRQRQIRKLQLERKEKQQNQIILKQAVQTKQTKQTDETKKLPKQQNPQNIPQKKNPIGQKRIFASKETKPESKLERELSLGLQSQGIQSQGIQSQSQNKQEQARNKPISQERTYIQPQIPKAQQKLQQKKPQTQQKSIFSLNPLTNNGTDRKNETPGMFNLFSQAQKPHQEIKKAEKVQQLKVNIPVATFPVNPPKNTQQVPKSTQHAVFPLNNVVPPVNNIGSVSNNANNPQRKNNQNLSIDNRQITENTKIYLQKLISYAVKTKQSCELTKAKTNNFGRSISNLKQLYETAIDFINSINTSNPKEVQTLGCKIFDFLFYTTIPGWPKQEGWEKFPPRGKNNTTWKISINTYVIKLNIYRAMGYEKLWLVIFGKLLNLLQFTWKREQTIQRYQDLELVKNKYFNLQKQDDMAPKYFTRLDLITYFLFCMTTFDPQLVSQYLYQTAKQDQGVYESIKKLKYKWNYNYFWILVDAIQQNKNQTYFRPILYMNILSSMYLQLRKNKINSTEFADFDHFKKYLLKEGTNYTNRNVLGKNKEIQTLAAIEEENQRQKFKFDGEDFLGQIQTLNFYFTEKQGQYRKGIEEFEKRCSIFDYFKSQSGGPS